MNIYISIDESWSYRFFEFNKVQLSTLDFFSFIDDFYKSAMMIIHAHMDFALLPNSPEFQRRMTIAHGILARYPELAIKIQAAYRELYDVHRVAFMAVERPVVDLQSICDEQGLLLGVVVVTC